MCLGIPLGMLLSPSPGQLLGSYVLNRVLAIRLDQWLKGILHQREKERKKERFKQIELPAKLLDYFLWSNESNINQSDWRNDVNTLIATGCTVTSKKKCTRSARCRKVETRNGHWNSKRNYEWSKDGWSSCLFSNEPFEKRPVKIILVADKIGDLTNLEILV